MGCRRLAQAGGGDALDQPRLLQRDKSAVQVIQPHGKSMQPLQIGPAFRRHGIGQDLLQLLLLLELGGDILHPAMQEGQSHLILRLPPPGGEAPARLGQNVDQPFVVVAGPACPAQHLVELMDIEPLYAHGQRFEDHLGGGKVHPRRQGGSGDHGMNPALSK